MADPISVGNSDVSMMSLMPTAMPRSRPVPAARGFSERQTKAPMVLSCASIASHDRAIAASGESSPESIWRCNSASEIIGIYFLQKGPTAFTDRLGIGQEPPIVTINPSFPHPPVDPFCPQGTYGHQNANHDTPHRRPARRLAAADPQ